MCEYTKKCAKCDNFFRILTIISEKSANFAARAKPLYIIINDEESFLIDGNGVDLYGG